MQREQGSHPIFARHRFFKMGMLGIFLFLSNVIPMTCKATDYTDSPAYNVPAYDVQAYEVRSGLFNDGKMHVILCGTGSPDIVMQSVRKPACLAVITDGHFLLFDAGDGSIQTLGKLKLPYQQVQRVFMTHWHSDHFAGLGMLINASWYSGRKQPIIVYGPYGIRQVMSGIAKSYHLDILFRAITADGLFDPERGYAIIKRISTQQLDKPLFTTKTFTVTPFAVNHLPVFPALGYRVHYKGCTIVISGDTRIVPNLEKNARNADVLINEALSHVLSQKIHSRLAGQRKSSEVKNKILKYYKALDRYHSDTWELAKMATQAKVKKLILTHLVPSIPTTQTAKQEFISGMNQYYSGPITVADDGDELVIESTGRGKCQVTFQKGEAT